MCDALSSYPAYHSYSYYINYLPYMFNPSNPAFTRNRFWEQKTKTGRTQRMTGYDGGYGCAAQPRGIRAAAHLGMALKSSGTI